MNHLKQLTMKKPSRQASEFEIGREDRRWRLLECTWVSLISQGARDGLMDVGVPRSKVKLRYPTWGFSNAATQLMLDKLSLRRFRASVSPPW